MRRGLIRVRGSAQHPIALAGALALCLPLGAYLAATASSIRRRHAWLAIDVLVLAAAGATVSRTLVVILFAMSAAAVSIWGQRHTRSIWLLVILGLVGLAAVAPATAPGSYASIKAAIHDAQGRAGERGSGRLADLRPGYRYWLAAPVLGHGVGTQNSTAGDVHAKGFEQDAPSEIIFDDQYLSTIVTTGIVGLAIVVWFIWGGVIGMRAAALRSAGSAKALIGACAVSCAGFGAGMITYDAFSFVQVTLLFFVIAAMGARMVQITKANA